MKPAMWSQAWFDRKNVEPREVTPETFVQEQLRKHEEYRRAYAGRFAGKTVKCVPGTKVIIR